MVDLNKLLKDVSEADLEETTGDLLPEEGREVSSKEESSPSSIDPVNDTSNYLEEHYYKTKIDLVSFPSWLREEFNRQNGFFPPDLTVKIIKTEFKDILEDSFSLFIYNSEGKGKNVYFVPNALNVKFPRYSMLESFRILSESTLVAKIVTGNRMVRVTKLANKVVYSPLDSLDDFDFCVGPQFSYFIKNGHRVNEIPLQYKRVDYSNLTSIPLKDVLLYKDDHTLELKVRFPQIFNKLKLNESVASNLKLLFERQKKSRDANHILTIDMISFKILRKL